MRKSNGTFRTDEGPMRLRIPFRVPRKTRMPAEKADGRPRRDVTLATEMPDQRWRQAPREVQRPRGPKRRNCRCDRWPFWLLDYLRVYLLAALSWLCGHTTSALSRPILPGTRGGSAFSWMSLTRFLNRSSAPCGELQRWQYADSCNHIPRGRRSAIALGTV